MKHQPIRRFVQKTKQLDPIKLGHNSFTYIDISSIDRIAKRIVAPQHLSVHEAPSRARKLILENDVLVSTVRPNLNNVTKVPKAYNGEIASTGFCVLRANGKELDSEYLFYFTQTAQFISRLTQLSTGAGYPAVTDNVVLDTEIPLPPLPEQQRIAAILEKADCLRRLRRYALEMGETFLQSVFLEMFGDPATNPMNWPTKSIGKMIKSIRYGTGSPPEFQDKGIPFIRATNIKKGTVQAEEMVYISEEDAKKIAKCKVKAGDLILVRSGVNTGDCALIPSAYDGGYAAYDLIIEVNQPYNLYLNHLINSPFGKAMIEPLSRRAGQPHLNAEQVKGLQFPFPPIELLNKFSDIGKRVNLLSRSNRESLRQANHLFQTLLNLVFNDY